MKDKKYYIIFSVPTFIEDWKNLYNKDQYELIIFALPGLFHSLKNNNQLKYFYKIIEITDLKFESLKEKFSNLISELAKDGVSNRQLAIIGDSEITLLKAAKIREAFQIPGPTISQILPFRNKITTKEKLKDLEKFLPKYIHFNNKLFIEQNHTYLQSIIDYLGFPMFAKPIDLGSSFGVTKINNKGELELWANQHKNNSFMEIDEFIDGTLYHCDSFIKEGKILRVDIGLYLNSKSEFLFDKPSCGSIDLLKTDPDWPQLAEFNQLILDRLQPPDGTTHLELFKMKNNKLKFVECAARSPGGIIPVMRKLSTGIDCFETNYKLQMGLAVDVTGHQGPYSAGMFFPKVHGVIKEQFEPKGIESHCIIEWFNKVGDAIAPRTALTYEPAYSIILLNKTYNILKKDFYKVATQMLYTVDKTNDIGSCLREMLY